MSDYAAPTQSDGGLARRALEALLVLLIFLGGLVLWLGIPAAWIWIASQLVEDYPSIYAVALVACPSTMAGWGWVLYRLYALYVDLHGVPEERRQTAWLKSLSGERGRRRPRTVLELSMTFSVTVALLTMMIWFFFFAHNYGPQLGN
jgi:hypothetical protein